MIYVASPYSDPDAAVRQVRAEAVARFTARMMALGYMAWSPIVHGHALAEHVPEAQREAHRFWMQHCSSMLKKADALVVLQLDGWLESRGVQWEIAEALGRGLPTIDVEPGMDDMLLCAAMTEIVTATRPCPFCGSTHLTEDAIKAAEDDRADIDVYECRMCLATAPVAVWGQRA